MKTITAVLLAACCVRADAAAMRTTAELTANPGIPVYPSPFMAHPDFPQLLAAPLLRVAAPDLDAASAQRAAAVAAIMAQKATIVDITPAGIAAVNQIPALAARNAPRESFETALASLEARGPITDPQRSAVSSVAKQAFDSKDVATLTRLALLVDPKRERALNDLLIEALNVLRHRVLTAESVEADIALGGLSNQQPLPDSARTWMADRVWDQAHQSYLAPSAQLSLPNLQPTPKRISSGPPAPQREADPDAWKQGALKFK